MSDIPLIQLTPGGIIPPAQLIAPVGTNPISCTNAIGGSCTYPDEPGTIYPQPGLRPMPVDNPPVSCTNVLGGKCAYPIQKLPRGPLLLWRHQPFAPRGVTWKGIF